MKHSLTILFVCLLPFVTRAQTTYYVSNSGSDGANGTSPSTSWQTLSKVNSSTFNPGDQILFKRGDVFVGKITINQSGTSSSPITFGAYGSGANPVFNSLRTVSSWTNLGSNIWESTNSVSVLPTLKLVLINSVNTPMGRYPNGDATYPFLPNYFTIDSHTGDGHSTTTITSSSLTTDWTGADVVVRVNHWTLDKEPIISQTDSTLTYVGQTESDPVTDGWGFWIQNDSLTLDRQNEWYYNPSNGRLRVYSTSQPSNVQITTTDTLIYSRVHDFITINNIDFKGANTSAIVFSACNNMTVTNCNFQYTGATAIEANDGSNNLDVENSTFYDIGGACVWNTDGGANWIIKNNTMKRIGLVSVIKNNDYTNGPIEIFSSNALVQYNTIDSTAYEGIHFRGNNVQIRNNFVNHTSMLRDDGGGIYTGFSNETGKIIEGNIVLNSIGNSRGVGSHDAAGNGIYLDGLSDGITVLNNTIAHIVSAGLFLNNDRGISAHNNTIYDIGGDYWTKGNLMVQTYAGAPYSSYQRNMNVTNNILFQKKPSQVNVFYYTGDATNTISQFGILDSNYYAKAIDTSYSIMYWPNGGGYQKLTFSQWQSTSGKEAHGQYLNQLVDTNNIKFVYNPTQNDSTVSLGAIYKDVKGVNYNNTITLQPYRSAILIYDSPSTPAPTVSVSGNQIITVDNTSVYATASWASGHTGTYQWTKISGTGSITSPTSSSTGLTGLSGTSIFRCTVTQDDGQTAYGEVTINVTSASATTYYVSNSGNDSNDGKTPATAWKTLDHVYNLFGNIHPGDSILLKRGEIWKESLFIPASGTAGNPIVFSAYGIGAKPIITKKDSISGWSNPSNWTQSGNTWYMNVPIATSSSYRRVWLNGVEVLNSETQSVTATAPTFYDISTHNLYIYSATNPAVTFTNIEVSNADPVNWNVVYAPTPKNYITLNNLDIRGGFISIEIVGGQGWVIDSCNIGTNGAGGVYGRKNSSFTCDNVIVKNCSFDTNLKLINTYESQATSDAVHLGDGCNNWQVYNNYFLDWGHSALAIHNTDVNFPSRNNIFHGNYMTAPDIDYGRAFNLDGVDTGMSGNEAYNNIAYDMPTNSQIENRGLKFYNNIIDKVTGISYRPGNGYGISISGYEGFHPENMQFFNNTIINCVDGAIHLVGWSAEVTQNNSFTNNIFAFNGSTNSNYQIVQDDENTSQLNNTWKNNLLYSTATTDVVYYGHSTTDNYPHTVAEFNSENGTAGDVISGNITGDPLLTPDYHLQAGSPAIDAGTDVGLPFIGLALDIGAYEYNNISPVSHAGSDVTITLPTNSLTLSGSGTDSDGTVASYSWSKISGGSYSIDNANIANPTLSNLVAGTYIFQLTVTDNEGAIGTDYLQIDVTPLVSITLNGGAGTQTTTNDSTDIGVTVVWASGHNGEVVWTQISGPNTAEITSYLSLQTWVKHLIPGTYTFRCTATQDDGQTIYVDATVKVLVPLIITPGQTFNLRTKTILYNQ